MDVEGVQQPVSREEAQPVVEEDGRTPEEIESACQCCGDCFGCTKVAIKAPTPGSPS
eukprot:CAMPEP_0115512554 /NCGR_PEP_ID=MMETSP0271-20121206/74575_1 /TAXON_ID=71861 /ORGANISM="Scrippsiella trochoidea, Strain CCMP3099" /LENGTH=56 /DNA_ID=CAMNT_0002942727 /DNA_START=22 /DNA_END=189 /DNA_ORIENTATION=+